MDELVTRRRFLSRLSLGLSSLAGVVVAAPIVSYLLSPLLRPAADQWLDLGPIDGFSVGRTVLRLIPDVAALAWAGKTAEAVVWVRRAAPQEFVVFGVNCTHLGCPVNWQPGPQLFLCPCHGGTYRADGSVSAGPPPHPLARHSARITSGRLEILSRVQPA